MLLHRSYYGMALGLIACLGCSDRKESVGPHGHGMAPGDASFTMGTGTSSSVLAKATFSDPKDQNFDVKRITDGWQMQIKSKPAFEMAVQKIVFQPHGQSGWHTHPGPVFIQVVAGTMTFYQSDDPTCSPIVRTAGQGYLDLGEHAHIARNETATPDTNVVIYFAPPGTPTTGLKIDAPDPGTCPF